MTRTQTLAEMLLKPRYAIVHMALTAAVIGGVIAFVAWHFKRESLTYQRQLGESAAKSPLPDVKVADDEVTGLGVKAYQKPYQFTQDWFTRNIPVWQKVLGPYKDKADVHYLEVGLFEGGSALWMLENILTHPSARLTGIDTFDGPWKEKYFANMELSGASAKVTTITDYSQVALRRLPLQSFDIIYIDGSHDRSDALEDVVLSYRLLKPGGIMICDDYRWAAGPPHAPREYPKPAFDAFMDCFEKQMTVVHNSYQLIVRKKP